MNSATTNVALVFGADLASLSPFAFGRVVERLLLHLGFDGVSNVDGTGDGGADLVGVLDGERWAFQVKSKSSGVVDESAVEELLRGMQKYGASRGAVVTNRSFSKRVARRIKELESSTGVSIRLWDAAAVIDLFEDSLTTHRLRSPEIRQYQIDALQAARSDIKTNGTAFIVLATGLGKTVIAGSIIDWFLSENASAKVLVLAHTIELVEQLERSLWRHLPKTIATQQVSGQVKPDNLSGVTVATIQSAINYIRAGFRPDFVFVDEAHHAGQGTQFAEALDLCSSTLRLGATATPWRGDEFDVTAYFGPPSFKLGIEEGMRLGYLVDVDYRLFIDNIDWDVVQSLSKSNLTVAHLNQKLFLPQRDEKIRDELLQVWTNTRNPRGIVFCKTIEHANRLHRVLSAIPFWQGAEVLHNGIPKAEQKSRLAKFRLGDVPILLAVDILNEGVDIPDVNIVCFARVTHSRRIFIQQLGRGLRLSPETDKTHVVVLDFVTDIKRVAAAMDLKSQVIEHPETVYLPSAHKIEFNDVAAESLLRQWIYDSANLDTSAREVRLNFPLVGGDGL